mmetsp:Transcript_10728/g.33732  ORF Transcript_10728/g.33732 Transcript_10728/m.33732 type:complete len:245 (+) Transcript_10728:211-945(+)
MPCSSSSRAARADSREPGFSREPSMSNTTGKSCTKPLIRSNMGTTWSKPLPLDMRIMPLPEFIGDQRRILKRMGVRFFLCALMARWTALRRASWSATGRPLTSTTSSPTRQPRLNASRNRTRLIFRSPLTMLTPMRPLINIGMTISRQSTAGVSPPVVPVQGSPMGPLADPGAFHCSTSRVSRALLPCSRAGNAARLAMTQRSSAGAAAAPTAERPGELRRARPRATPRRTRGTMAQGHSSSFI